MNKEQYKTYLRQRLYEEHSDNHDIYYDMNHESTPAQHNDLDHVSTPAQKYDYHESTPAQKYDYHESTPAQLALQQKSDAAAWARLDVVNNGFDVDPRNSKKMDDHPHGALTRAISRHTGLHPLEVFEFTRNLTASSPQKDIDREIQHFVGLQLSRQTTGREPYFGDEEIRNEVTPKFSDLSKQPGSPYFVPSLLDPDGIYDLAVAQHAAYAAEKGPRERFIRDFSKHINDNVSTGVHTEFTGAPRANGT